MPHNQPHDNDDNGNQEQEQTKPVDAMHIFHPLGAGLVGIGLAQVKVFCNLAKYIHKKTVS